MQALASKSLPIRPDYYISGDVARFLRRSPCSPSRSVFVCIVRTTPRVPAWHTRVEAPAWLSFTVRRTSTESDYYTMLFPLARAAQAQRFCARRAARPMWADRHDSVGRRSFMPTSRTRRIRLSWGLMMCLCPLATRRYWAVINTDPMLQGPELRPFALSLALQVVMGSLRMWVCEQAKKEYKPGADLPRRWVGRVLDRGRQLRQDGSLFYGPSVMVPNRGVAGSAIIGKTY